MNRFRPLALFALCLAAAAPAFAKPQIHRGPHPSSVAHPARLASGGNVTMPQLTWCGGRVLTSAKIVAVFWGPPDALAATPSCQGSTFKGCIDSYLNDFVNDPQFDWIDEYQTPTGQTNGGLHISRASYSGSYQITPINTATTIGESATETELSAQIQAGHLPAPDSNNQTLYEIFFPLSVFPEDLDPSDPSNDNVACCDFCAYHDSYNSNVVGKELMFGIFPSAVPGGYTNQKCEDGTSTPDCSGCGERADWFQNLGGSISHEIFETITDPDIGLAGNESGCDPEIGWYDNSNSDAMSAHGEVADMCEAFNDADYSHQITEETFTAQDGTSYTVQRLWSNAHNACLADDSGAFSINNPTRTTAIKAPRNATTLISLPSTGTLDAGPLPITFAFHWADYPDAGLPAGVSATIAPASPETGENSVLALTLTNSASTSFTFGVSAENGIAQAQTVVEISATGISAPDAGTPGAQTDGGTGGNGGGSAGGSAGGSGGGSGGGTAGGSGGGTAGGSGGGTAGGSGGGTAGGAGGGSAGGSGGGSGGGSAGGSGGGSAGGTGGGSGGSGGISGFTASASPASLTLTAGSAATSTTLTTHLSSGSSGFTVRASGITGVSATPSTGTVGTPLALGLSAEAGTPSSTGTISLALTASSLTASAALAVTISGDDATLSAPSQETVQPGASVQFEVTSATTHGQPQLLQLSTTGLPAGATATFNPPQITSGSSSMAIINVPAGATIGVVPVVIVGQGPVAKVTSNLQLGVGTTFSSGGCASTDPVPLALLGLLAIFGASKRKRARMAAVRVF